jgi:hypothetical protein
VDLTNSIEVRPNIFLSKNDPDFHRKFLSYFPENKTSLYKYGMQLLEEGKEKKGFSYIEKAASLDYIPAIKRLERSSVPSYAQPLPEKPPILLNSLILTSIILVILIVLFLFIALWYALSNDNTSVVHNEHSTSYERSTSNSSDDIKTSLPIGEKTTENILPALVVQNAIERYKDIYGSYPLDEKTLLGNAPKNELSYIPKGITYTATETGYKIKSEEVDNDLFINGLLSLHFYPNSNQLTLQRGTEVLVKYLVASGKSEPLPNTSTVTARVVDPKGKNGAYGSRGLALTDNFAIHGTNDPENIGKKVTEGCLRLTNDDIESLFPYVSLGTPFIVEEHFSKPAESTFTKGLPFLSSKPISPSKEETNVVYDWKE